MIKSLKKLLKAGSRSNTSRSRFEQYEFSPVRFDCTLSSMSRSSACEGLFLDTYTQDDIRDMLDRSGLAGHLRNNGFVKQVLNMEKTESGIHILRIYDGKEAPERLLIEIRLSRIIYMPDERHVRGVIRDRRFNVMAVEWLTLQNPKLSFTSSRPRLPGQAFPGLGAVQYIATLIEMCAADLGVEAVLDVPDQFHAAVMYSQKFKFMDPAREGMLRAVLRDLKSHSLADLSWGFITGTICDARTGEPFPYEPSEQVLPIAESLALYFSSREYLKRVEKAMNGRKYTLNHHRMARERANHPDYKHD